MKFEVRVYRLVVEPHPDPEATAIALARVGDYRSVVRKGEFVTGDLAAYIPEGALVPAPVLEALGLTGRLAGAEKNRVKAIRLRGVLSQGLVLPARPGWEEGQDVQEELGVTKYQPPIPVYMAGEVFAIPDNNTVAFDIENIKKYPDILREGELVHMTEKIHGTFCQVGWMPEAHPEAIEGHFFVASKGLGGKGLVFKDNAENARNVYLQVVFALELPRRMREVFGEPREPVIVMGEVFGHSIQDLSYQQVSGRPGFRVFAIARGYRGARRYLDDAALDAALVGLGLERVPVLYRGPFSKEILATYTDGKETVSGRGAHLREGLVVVPCEERYHPEIGRVALKSVSDAYLLRKGDATERE